MRPETERRIQLFILGINRGSRNETISATFPQDEFPEVAPILYQQLQRFCISDIATKSNPLDGTFTVMVRPASKDPYSSLENILTPYLEPDKNNVTLDKDIIGIPGSPCQLTIDDFLSLCLLEAVEDLQGNGMIRKSKEFETVFKVRYDSIRIAPQPNPNFNFLGLAGRIKEDSQAIKAHGLGKKYEFPIFDFSVCFKRDNSPLHLTIKVFDPRSIFYYIREDWFAVNDLIIRTCSNNFRNSPLYAHYCRGPQKNKDTFYPSDMYPIARQADAILPWLRQEIDLKGK